MHRIPMLPQCLEGVVHNKRAKLRVTASVNATAHVCAKSMFLLQGWDERHTGTATFSLSFLYNAVIKSFLKRACLHRNAPGMSCYQKIHTFNRGLSKANKVYSQYAALIHFTRFSCVIYLIFLLRNV